MGAGDDHTRGALAALERAEDLSLRIHRGLRRRALREQFALGARPSEEDALPETFRAYLWLPGWAWMLFGALVAVFSVPVPGAALAVTMGAAALAALVLRTALTLQAAPRLFLPEAGQREALRAALAEADGHMQAAGALDPYRGQALGWVGPDPAAAERPWSELATIRRTAAAVRTRALPAAKDGDKTGG